MTKKDIKKYAAQKWGDYIEPITDLSRSSSDGVPLINSEKKYYNFDKICQSIFLQSHSIPASADALMVDDKKCVLVEFKKGFKSKISNRYDPEKAHCAKADTDCKLVWELYKKIRNLEIQDLISNIGFKAIESFATVDSCICPKCEEKDRDVKICFIVVIDDNSDEGIEYELSELAGEDIVIDNTYTRVKQSLKRFSNLKDAEGNTYFYDQIEVMTVQDFNNSFLYKAL